ncbi:MAG TPA: hypothetical protein PL056_02760, partial [bacterium]|nr:hypothetical protein [bacterium]
MKKILSALMFFGFCMFLYSDSLNESSDPDDNWVSISEHQGVGWNGLTSVKSIHHYEDYIYVGGEFSAVKSTLANSVARLHLPTGIWSALGSGLNGGVVSLSIVNSEKIFAAGQFQLEDDDHYYDGVYMWNGENWEVISLDFDGDIFSTAIDKNGNLYVAGEFRNIGDVEVNNVAKWDGKKWSSLGNGSNYEVTNIMFDKEGNLLANGGFLSSDEKSVYYFAKWDGQNWISQETGSLKKVSAFTIGKDGYLYLIGFFDESYIGKIVKWDGNDWTVLNENS